MKIVSMSGSPRENVGKKDANALRRQGLVPCVLYGGKEQIHFVLKELDFRELIFNPDASLVRISVNGKSIDAVLQDIQYHPVTDRVIHADFLEVLPGKPIKIDVPITVVGNSPGVIKGGKLHIKQRKLKVKGLVDAIPDHIDIDISSLEIGDSVVVSEVKEEGIELLNIPNSVVVMVKTTRVAATEEEEAAEAEEAAEGAEGAEKPEGGDKPAEGGKSEEAPAAE